MFLSLSLLGYSASAQQDGHMVCSYTKPQDMSNVETLYSHDGKGNLRERYCTTTKATAQMAPSQFLAASGPLKDFPNCEHPALPNLPGSGYNILTGMPLATGENGLDPGYLNAPVFDLTFNECRTTQPQPDSGYWTYTIPDVYNFQSLSVLTAGQAMDSMHDEKSFQKQAKNSLSVSGGGTAFGVGLEFTAGAQWETATSSLSEGDTVEQRFKREALAYQTTLQPYDLKLSETYLQALSTAYITNEWSIFFLSYGTHVTTEIITGARYSQVSQFRRQKFEEISSNRAAYNMGIKASYEGATGSMKAETETEKRDRNMVESSAYNQYIVSTGGDGAAFNAESMSDYQVAAHNHPAPLRSSMIPHEVLIKESKWSEFTDALATNFPDNPQAKSVTREQFSSVWLSALQAFCGEDAHKCQAVTSSAAPEKMTLTNMFYDSPNYGEANGGKVVGFDSMPPFQHLKPLVRISNIRTFCSKVGNGRYRFRGIQFEYFDGDRSEVTDVLGTQGNSDSDAGEPWDSKNNVIAYGEVISAVKVSSGADVDGIWFTVQSLKDATTRTVGCGYNGNNMRTWNIETGQKLLAFSGTSVEMDGFTIVKSIQFRSYLYILPTLTPNGVPECKCVTPNQGTVYKNGAACTNGNFHWCEANQFCTNGDSFPEDQFSSQCKEQPQSFLASVPANSFLADSKPADAPKLADSKPADAPKLLAHHQVLLQQIENLKASKNAKGSKVRSAAPPTAPKAKKESKWDEAKHMVEKMSKKLKQEVKAELKDFLIKELKSGLGDLQTKQSHLERTVTRMLMHQVESL